MTPKRPSPAPSAPARKQILIVDDHPIFREGLAQSLGREPDLAVCGEAENGRQALESIQQLRPDLVTLDLTLPGQSGVELIQELKAKHPRTALLVVSMHDEALYAAPTLRAGAQGYVMKHEKPATLLAAIRRVLSGEIYVSDRMSALILESYSGHPSPGAGSPMEQLSDRETEVFQLIGQGLDNRAIAKQLNLSLKTIAVHQANIRRKLNLRHGSDLIRFAVQWETANR